MGERDPGVALAALAPAGLLSAAAPRLVEANFHVAFLLSWRYLFQRDPTTSLDASGGSVFLNLIHPAKGALDSRRRVNSIVGPGQLNR